MEPVPDETARIARAAFPKGHPYLTCRDALGTILQDEDWAPLYAQTGQPGFTPWRLALVTILPFRENLADRQAAEAVRARIDWKYLLSLALTAPGFDFAVLSEVRDRLLAGSAEAVLLDKLLERCRALGLLKARGPQRTDSTHVLAAIRVLNRVALVAETLRAPSTPWPPWPLTGGKDWHLWPGMNGMADGLRRHACPGRRRNATPRPRPWGRMASTSSTPWTPRKRPRACGSYP